MRNRRSGWGQACASSAIACSANGNGTTAHTACYPPGARSAEAGCIVQRGAVAGQVGLAAQALGNLKGEIYGRSGEHTAEWHTPAGTAPNVCCNGVTKRYEPTCLKKAAMPERLPGVGGPPAGAAMIPCQRLFMHHDVTRGWTRAASTLSCHLLLACCALPCYAHQRVHTPRPPRAPPGAGLAGPTAGGGGGSASTCGWGNGSSVKFLSKAYLGAFPGIVCMPAMHASASVVSIG